MKMKRAAITGINIPHFFPPDKNNLEYDVKRELPHVCTLDVFHLPAYHKSSLPTGSHVRTCLEAAISEWQIMAE